MFLARKPITCFLGGLLFSLLASCSNIDPIISEQISQSSQNDKVVSASEVTYELEAAIAEFYNNADITEEDKAWMQYLYVTQLSPSYTLYKYDDGTPMGSFMLFDVEDKNFTKIKCDIPEFYFTDMTQINLSETDNTITFRNSTGTRLFRPDDFPHAFLYNISEATVSKKYLMINSITSYQRLGYNPYTVGAIRSVELLDNRCSIFFDIDITKQTANADTYFPEIDYSFCEDTGTVSVVFRNITCDDKSIFKKLGELPGISDISVKGARPELPSSTSISFVVDESYALFGEVIGGEQFSPSDNLSFWTEKRG